MAAGSTAPSEAMLGEAARRTVLVRCREFDSEVGMLCSITSSDGAASLLVCEDLPNGSLYERLHGAAVPGGKKLGGGLRRVERHEVAVCAARGLEYLHHGCDRPILHLPRVAAAPSGVVEGACGLVG